MTVKRQWVSSLGALPHGKEEDFSLTSLKEVLSLFAFVSLLSPPFRRVILRNNFWKSVLFFVICNWRSCCFNGLWWIAAVWKRERGRVLVEEHQGLSWKEKRSVARDIWWELSLGVGLFSFLLFHLSKQKLIWKFITNYFVFRSNCNPFFSFFSICRSRFSTVFKFPDLKSLFPVSL